MAGPFQAVAQSFNPLGLPPGSPLYQPAPPTDQSQNTAALLARLAQSLFSAQGTQASAPSIVPPGAVAPTAPQSGVPQSGLLPGEMHIPQSVLNPGSAPGFPPNAYDTASSGGGPALQSSQSVGIPAGPPSGDTSLPIPMLKPGSGAGGDPGSILQTAVQAGQQAQDNPDITGQVIKDLMASGGDPSQNKWLALAKAGFAMAASRNPSFFGAAGEGGLAGLSDYLKSRQEGLANRYSAAQLQQAQQSHAAEIANQKAERAFQEKEFSEKVREYEQSYPAEEALKMAQADYYKNHGDYFAAGGGHSGSGGGAGGYMGQAYNAIYQSNLASGRFKTPGEAAADAMQKTKGFLSQRDRYANSYIKTSMGGMADITSAPADVLAKAYDYADGQLGGGAPAAAVGTAAPAGGQPQGGAAATIAAAKDAIAKGADPAAVKARLQSLGIDPTALGQ